MLLNQQHQSDVDGITPMPTDRVDDTSVVNDASAEAVVWFYSNSGVWAAASGQAAGTMCYSNLVYTGITNSGGSSTGHYGDTSLSFAAATRASTLKYVPEEAFSKMEKMSVADKVAYVATWLTTNGDYAIDHRRGAVWLLIKADPTNDAATYKYQTPLTGGGAGDKVDLIKVGGQATPVDDAAMAASPAFVPGGGEYRAAEDTYTDGDAVVDHYDINGNKKVVGKAYDSLTQADRTAEVNTLNMQYVSEVTTFTNVANATPEYAYVELKPGYKFFTIQGVETGGTDSVTYTFEGTCLDDGTVQASCPYIDKSTDWFGGSATADFLYEKDTPSGTKYVRVKVTTAGTADDWDGYVIINKYY